MAEQVMKTVSVKGSPEAVYDLWADFENFPHFMDYVKSVKKHDATHSEWVVEGPLGRDVTWDAEMTRGERGKRIAWNSKDHEGTVATSGQVTFIGLPQGQTDVTVLLQYTVPGGKVGTVVAELFSDPESRLERDLRNFKTFAENRLAGGD